MAPTRPTELHQRRFRLSREPAAAAEARGQVRAVIRAWQVPVDPDIAVLLTSDLVTSAIMHGSGETVMLVIRCPRGQLRIDVYDTSRSLPIAAAEPAGTATGRGLALVAALSTEWGSFRTPAGEAVYFTLAFRPDLPEAGDRATAGDTRRAFEPGARLARRPASCTSSKKTPTSEGVTWQAPPSGVRMSRRVQAFTGLRAP